MDEQVICPRCHGAGDDGMIPCPECGGNGTVDLDTAEDYIAWAAAFDAAVE